MQTISTGENSTLGTYRKLAEIIFGEHSKAVEFMNEQITASLVGEDEEVIADESQMIQLLVALEST